MDVDFTAWREMDSIDPRLIVTDPDLAALLPESVARAHNVLPQGRQGNVLRLLIGDPIAFETMDLLRFVFAPCSTTLRFTLTSPESIRQGIDRVYGPPDP